MKIVGLITELNPFHNGHKYYIEEAKKIAGADFCILVMSGDYVQRGEPAFFDKFLRTQAALQNGADLVIELPVCFATASAEYFAAAAVSLLDQLGVVTDLVFGSECGDLTLLQDIALILSQEPEAYKLTLQSLLKSGLSFPSARQLALEKYLALENLLSEAPHTALRNSLSDESYTALDKLSSVFASPNNILGIEYLKALHNQNSSMKPFTITRKGSAYHDAAIDLGKDFASASALRKTFTTQSSEINFNFDDNDWQKAVPRNCISLYYDALQSGAYLTPDDYSLPMITKLLSLHRDSLTSYQDISSDLADKIYKNRYEYHSFSNACDLLKSKDLTYSRISRALMHILLDIKSEQMQYYKEHHFTSYARILGFRRDASELLSAIKCHSSIPMISKLSDASRQLSPEGYGCLVQTLEASQLYYSIRGHKNNLTPENEFRRQIILL